MSKERAALTTGLLASALLLGGCGLLPTSDDSSTSLSGEESLAVKETPATPSPSAESSPPEEPAGDEAEVTKAEVPEEEPAAANRTPDAPVAQAEDCGWDSPKVSGDASTLPGGAGGDLNTAIIGAWQHTHFDSGSGFEALGEGEDIRYVFPSATRILYCQDIKGATDHAQNAADISFDGTSIIMPGAHKGFEVTAWDANTMVWTNNLDGSTYLLKRR